MPSKEFLELVALIDTWSNHDNEYLRDCTLKENAPEYVRDAFKVYKAKIEEFKAEGINV